MPRLNLEIANSPWDQTQTCELLAPYCKDQDTHRKSLPQLSTVSACILGALMLFSFVSADATSKHKSSIEMIYQPLPNGDFRLSLYGSDRALVCEEKDIKIIQQGDAVNPLVFECKH
jgi:hypothetical protein